MYGRYGALEIVRLGPLLSCALLLLALGSEIAVAQVILQGNLGAANSAPNAQAFWLFEGENDKYSVWLAQPPAGSMTVSITGDDGTGLSLNKTSLTFTPSNWDIPQTVLMSSAENQSVIVSRGESVLLVHTPSDGSAGHTLRVVILDNEGVNEVTLIPPNLAIPEGSSGSMGVRLKSPITQTITVDFEHRSTESGQRVAVNPTSLVFTPSNWNRFQRIVVTVTEDEGAEKTENFLIGAGPPSGTPGWTASRTVFSVQAVETPTSNPKLLVPSSVQVAEGATVDYEVHLGTQPSSAVTVGIAVPAGSGLTLDKTSLMFNPTGTDLWSTPQTVTITAAEDDDDLNEAATLRHTASGGDYAGLTANLLVTTFDLPDAITLTVDADTGTNGVQTSLAENGGAKMVRVTATINGVARFNEAKAVTVKVGKSGDSAVEGTDYDTVADLTITIPAGMASATADFTLTPKQDVLDEPDEAISIDGELTDVKVGGTSVMLTDDDATTVTLAVPDATATEGSTTDTARITLTLNRGLVAGESLGIPLAFDGGTAGTDFTLALAAPAPAGVTLVGTAVTFTGPNSGATATTAAVLLTASADADTTDDTVTVSIPVSTTAARQGDPSLAATGLDGDATGSRAGNGEIELLDSAVADVTVAETSGGTAVTEAAGAGNRDTYTLVLTAIPRNDVTITVTPAEGLLVDGPDTPTAGKTAETLTFTASNWNSSQTVTVIGVDDAIDQGASHTLTITHAAASDDDRYDEIDIDDVEVTVTDDDDAPDAITLTVDADTGTQAVQTSLAEDGGAKTVRVTAAITSATRFNEAKAITVKVGKSGDSAVEGTDYDTVADLTITIPAGMASATADFTLTPRQDVLDEPDEAISIDGELTGVTVTGTVVTLTDDDAAPDAITLTVDADTGTARPTPR